MRDALSADNAVRRRAEETLRRWASRQGFAVALAKRLAENATAADGDDPLWMPKRRLAGMLLQQCVRSHWGSKAAALGAIAEEDKAEV